MKFSCDQQELVRALSVVSKAVTTRTTTQVMKGILIEAKEGGTLTMSASDLDISIQNTMQADVQEEGSVIAMAKLFVDIIRKLPHSEITIESDDDFNITIRSANSEFQVVGMSPDEFPERIKEQEGDKYIEFNRREFSSMIEKTAFAASIEEARGIITGVLLEIEPDGMNMVAIDGYRMAINKSAMVTGASGNVVIAAKMLGEIGKILADVGEDETGRLYLNEKKAVFLFDQTQAELKLMEGEFIRYKDILPREKKIRLVIDRVQLLNSIERASLLSRSGKNNLIRMNLTDNLVTISSTSEEGNVREEILVEKEGEDLVIGFNAQYMMDVLKKIDDEKILMYFNTQITPCVIEPLEGNQYEFIVLPVRIN